MLDGKTMKRFDITRREGEVLTLILSGKSSQAVADQLFISRRTVDFHLQNCYEKMGVHSRMEARNKIDALRAA